MTDTSGETDTNGDESSRPDAGISDFASFRRDVLKAVGAGSALTVLGGAAAAQADDGSGDDGDTADGSDANGGDGTAPQQNTVHVVETLIGPSTNPDRPADFHYQPTGLHVQPGDVVKFVFRTPDHNVTSYHPAFGMQRRIPSGVQPFSSPILGWDPASLPDDISMPPSEGVGEPTDENGSETPSENGTETPGEETPPGDTETAMSDNETEAPDNETSMSDNETETPTEESSADVSDDGESAMPQPSTWLHAFETPGVYDMECAPHEEFGMAMRVVVGDETETDFETQDPGNLPEPRAGPVGLARVTLTDPGLAPERIVEEGTVMWEDLEATGGATSPPTEDGSTTSGNETENGA